MTDESLFAEKEKDGFNTESPVRGFTDFNVNGRYAIGKGFRPSPQHLSAYLDAMEAKEGWQTVQVLDAGSRAGLKSSPLTVLFRRCYKFNPDWKAPTIDEYVDVGEDRVAHFINGSDGSVKEIHIRDKLVDDVDPTARIPAYTFKVDGIDPEKTHWSKAKWSYSLDTLLRAFSDVQPPVARLNFLQNEKVDSVDHFRSVASVASVIRMADFCHMNDRFVLLDPMSATAYEAIYRQPKPEATSERRIGKHPALAAPYGGNYPDPQPILEPAISDGHSATIKLNDVRASHLSAAFTGRADEETKAFNKALQSYLDANKEITVDGAKINDDPINPKHYNGTACAEIGEILTANSYQVLKYNWRLGEKDDELIELGKAIWYLNREIALAKHPNFEMLGSDRLPHWSWFAERTKDQNDHVKMVASKIISWNRYGKIQTLLLLLTYLEREIEMRQPLSTTGQGQQP